MTTNAEDVHQKYVEVLGEEFGNAFYHCISEWSDLWITWRQFENLFGNGRERVELMNKAGSSFFYRVDRLFFEAAVLAVCRLSDPIRTGNKNNLTMHLFQQFMETSCHQEKMKQHLENINKTTAFARDWRNRKISHNDFSLKTGDAVPLAKATRNQMNTAIATIHETLAFISFNFMDTHLADEVLDDHNNEMVMLNRLYLGVEFHEQELTKLKSGKYTERKLPNWL